MSRVTNSNRGLVSVITPSFNCGKYIVETYKSLRMQTYQDWEWLVADDCSTDDTVEILRDIESKDIRVKVGQFSVNMGPSSARNWCLDNASGEYLAFLDADDLWLPHKLSSQIRFMDEGRKVFTFTSYGQLDQHGNRMGSAVDTRSADVVDYPALLRKRATVGCSTVMLMRAGIESELRFPDIRSGQDYAFWLSILKRGHKAYRLNELSTLYRVLPGSVSRNKFRKAARQWQIYRELEGLPLLQSLECFAHYGWNAVVRK